MQKIVAPIIQVQYGSDPELFFIRDGKVIGSEKVIPRDGFKSEYAWSASQIVRDGVQCELHPSPIFGYANPFTSIFNSIRKHLPAGVEITLKEMVEVSRAELDSLLPENQVLGCMPSKNLYKLKKVSVDGREYRMRSAGGHLHLGVNGSVIQNGTNDYRTRLVALCDVLLGNTMVLLDRDPDQIERRKVYGQAGEYRLPKYGVEYRTLSNFWLRSPALTELVYGLGAQAVAILANTITEVGTYEEALLSKLDYRKVIKAIQLNDLQLAMENWAVVKDFLKEAFGEHYQFTLTSSTIPAFEKLVAKVNSEGPDTVFPVNQEAVFKAWQGTVTTIGWRPYLTQLV